jgi:hypothetical protein
MARVHKFAIFFYPSFHFVRHITQGDLDWFAWVGEIEYKDYPKEV